MVRSGKLDFCIMISLAKWYFTRCLYGLVSFGFILLFVAMVMGPHLEWSPSYNPTPHPITFIELAGPPILLILLPLLGECTICLLKEFSTY